MIAKIFYLSLFCSCFSSLVAQNTLELDIRYDFERFITGAPYEDKYNFHFTYNDQIKDSRFYMSYGLNYQSDHFEIGGKHWRSASIIQDNELVEYTMRIHTEGYSKSVLGTLGCDTRIGNLSFGAFTGLGFTHIDADWYYVVANEESTLNKHSFSEEFDNTLSYMIGSRIVYSIDMTERLSLGLSLSASYLKAAQSELKSTSGEYSPISPYDPKLDRDGTLDYKTTSLLAGINVAYRL